VGTQWQTALLCEGTRVTVTSGVVRVRDKLRGRNVLLRAGQSFLVRTSGARRGQ
jgi:ferric-dicitrate binding protein FerR (iron transport regulator)